MDISRLDHLVVVFPTACGQEISGNLCEGRLAGLPVDRELSNSSGSAFECTRSDVREHWTSQSVPLHRPNDYRTASQKLNLSRDCSRPLRRSLQQAKHVLHGWMRSTRMRRSVSISIPQQTWAFASCFRDCTFTHGGGRVPSGHDTTSTSSPHFLISYFSVADRATVSGLGLNRSACGTRAERRMVREWQGVGAKHAETLGQITATSKPLMPFPIMASSGY